MPSNGKIPSGWLNVIVAPNRSNCSGFAGTEAWFVE